MCHFQSTCPSQNSVVRADWEKVAFPRAQEENEMRICEQSLSSLCHYFPLFLLCLQSPSDHRTFPLFKCMPKRMLDFAELHGKPEMTWIN